MAVETKRLQVTFGVHRPAIFQGYPMVNLEPPFTSHTSRRPSRHGPELGAGQHANGGSWAAYPFAANSPYQPQGAHSGRSRLTGQRPTSQYKTLGSIIPTGVIRSHLHKAGVPWSSDFTID